MAGMERSDNDNAGRIENDLLRTLGGSGSPNEVGKRLHSEHPAFKGTIALIVLTNTIAMGVEADYPTASVWRYTENFFCAAFFLEAVFKFYELQREYFSDHYHKLDFFLVVVSVVDTWVLSFLGSSINMRSISILRLLRLVRLVRVLRVIKGCEKFVLVIGGIIEAMQSTFWVSTVLFIAIYVSSVFCVGFLGHDYGRDYPGYSEDAAEIDELEVMVNFNPRVYFGTMTQSMLTLFNIAILAEWPEVVRPLMIKQPWLVVFFVMFVMVVTFGILNVIIGMIVDSVMQNARKLLFEESQRELDAKVKILKSIQALVQEMDSSGDGRLSFAELEREMASDDSVLRILLGHADLHLPVGFSAKELLLLLDRDGDEVLDCKEFVQSFYRLVDSGPFQQICLLQTGINSLMLALRKNHKDVCGRLTKLERGGGGPCSRGEAQAKASSEVKASSVLDFPLGSSSHWESTPVKGAAGRMEDEDGEKPEKEDERPSKSDCVPASLSERELQEKALSRAALGDFLQALPGRFERSLERMERDLEDLLQANLSAVKEEREARLASRAPLLSAQASPRLPRGPAPLGAQLGAQSILATQLHERTAACVVPPAVLEDFPLEPHEVVPPSPMPHLQKSPFPRNRFPAGTQFAQILL